MVVKRYMEYKPLTVMQSLYTLHRINPSRLFFSDKDDQRLQAETAATMINARLPRPTLTFYPPSKQGPSMDFTLVGSTKDRIVALDYLGSAFLYDDALRAVYPLPSMKGRKQNYPVSVAVGDDLFVMSREPHPFGNSAEALIDHTYWWPRSEMHWHSIPPPPYVKPEEELNQLGCGWYSEILKGSVYDYTAVVESDVWVSAPNYGTYSFDMKKDFYNPDQGAPFRLGQWSKVGDWVLPFQGRAVYAPELKLWFGFSEQEDDNGLSNRFICTADLEKAGAAQPPVVSHQWSYTAPKDQKYNSRASFLVHLGTGGRFCVANFLTGVRRHSMAMLTGVEVTRCGEGEALRFIEHKTYRYGGLSRGQYHVCLL
jgi:hypothetical protein